MVTLGKQSYESYLTLYAKEGRMVLLSTCVVTHCGAVCCCCGVRHNRAGVVVRGTTRTLKHHDLCTVRVVHSRIVVSQTACPLLAHADVVVSNNVFESHHLDLGEITR